MARGRKAKKLRAYKPKVKRIFCERQFPECPPEPNPVDCKGCPLYKAAKPSLTKEEKEKQKKESKAPEIESDENVDLSYEEEKFEVEEPGEKKEETAEEPKEEESEKKEKKKEEGSEEQEDELEKATRPDEEDK